MKFKLNHHAFSLIEIVLALGILSFCLVLLLGLLPAGIKTNEISSEESNALNLMSAIVSDLKYSPKNSNKSVIFQLEPLPFTDQAGVGKTNMVYLTESWRVQRISSPQSDSKYQVFWYYTKIPLSPSLAPVEAVIRVSWPARGINTPNKWDACTESYITFKNPDLRMNP